jgi:hypothetical protein
LAWNALKPAGDLFCCYFDNDEQAFAPANASRLQAIVAEAG